MHAVGMRKNGDDFVELFFRADILPLTKNKAPTEVSKDFEGILRVFPRFESLQLFGQIYNYES